MKSHGIKPIKVAVPAAESRHNSEEDDSQEHDFAVEEDRTSSGSDGSGQPADTQPTGPNEVPLHHDELGELAFLTSPRASSLRSVQITSSQGSRGHQTDASSLEDDDELPNCGRALMEQARHRQEEFSTDDWLAATLPEQAHATPEMREDRQVSRPRNP